MSGSTAEEVEVPTTAKKGQVPTTTEEGLVPTGSVIWEVEHGTDTHTLLDDTPRCSNSRRYCPPISHNANSEYLKTIEGILRIIGIVRI